MLWGHVTVCSVGKQSRWSELWVCLCTIWGVRYQERVRGTESFAEGKKGGREGVLNIDKNEKRRKEKKSDFWIFPTYFLSYFLFCLKAAVFYKLLSSTSVQSRRHPCKFPHLDELSSLDSLSLRKPACVYCEWSDHKNITECLKLEELISVFTCDSK